ncbi:GtrA family protein [Thauera aromatica]|uniref:GtrA/DPMS transmembrane domain-containing protein n=1 Tax=Thauera aromatica K172 TaxID=44139 RepID=A0A2R4BKE3_THAAR|nr:GtrA family protein [Thauera aromatica]AVR87797.1 hypothetical protein Tharo_0855 [Thauera aromatica K172]
MRLSEGVRRFVRFAAVGLVGTAAHYALLIVLVEVIAAPPVLGAAAGFCLGAVVNYGLSRVWVFDSDRGHLVALSRFLLIALMGLGWTALLMLLLARMAGLHYLVAQLLTTALVLFWHFAGNALWTFRRQVE